MQHLTQEAAGLNTPPPKPQSAPLGSLMDPEPYRLQRASHVLRTQEAFRWLVRGHHKELVDAGAMVKLSGRWMVHADRFDDALLQIGKRLAGGT